MPPHTAQLAQQDATDSPRNTCQGGVQKGLTCTPLATRTASPDVVATCRHTDIHTGVSHTPSTDKQRTVRTQFIKVRSVAPSPSHTLTNTDRQTDGQADR